MYREKSTGKEVEAERLTEKRTFGTLTIPAGYWYVTLDGKKYATPSDEKFNLNYELVEESKPNVTDEPS